MRLFILIFIHESAASILFYCYLPKLQIVSGININLAKVQSSKGKFENSTILQSALSSTMIFSHFLLVALRWPHKPRMQIRS